MGDMEELKKRLEKEQREIRIRKFTKNKASVFGLVVVTVMILLAVLAPLICRYDPLALDVKSRLQGCSADHWFGTDTMGRDVFARLVYGFRISMTFALWVTLCSFFTGTVIGGILGYFGRWIDLFGVRCIEIFSGIPFLYMTMILSSFLQPSFIMLSTLVILMGGWIGIAYYMRGEFYREKAKEYVLSAKALGAGNMRIMFRHILPNAMTPLITFFPFALVGNIGALVSLDFMGLGLKAPTPSWGELLNQWAGDIQYWWLVAFPLTALFLTLLMITFIGESLRDAFDPKPAAMIQ